MNTKKQKEKEKKEIRKFLIQGIAFTFTLITIILLTNTILSKTIYEEKTIYKKNEYTKQYFSSVENKKNTQIGFFGNSQIIHGINPQYIPNSYNFAFNGNRYPEDYYELKRAIEKLEVPINTVILQIDPGSFGSPNIRENYINHPEVRKEYVPIKEMAKLNERSLAYTYITSRFVFLNNLPELLYQVYIKFKTTSPYGEHFVKGWQSFITTEFPDHTVLPYNRTHNLSDKLAFDYFLKTLEYAQEEDINVILIKTPQSNAFREHANKESLENYYQQIYNNIHNYKYQLLDYSGLFMEQEDAQHFSDLNHLNPEGARVLSEKIAADLQTLKVIEQDKK